MSCGLRVDWVESFLSVKKGYARPDIHVSISLLLYFFFIRNIIFLYKTVLELLTVAGRLSVFLSVSIISRYQHLSTLWRYPPNRSFYGQHPQIQIEDRESNNPSLDFSQNYMYSTKYGACYNFTIYTINSNLICMGSALFLDSN